jgi:thiamine biosynthesis protein ThiS
MTIQLNGEPRALPGAMTVAELLRWLDIDARIVAVEVDRKVVARARYGDTPLSEGAEVEVVAFVGGGSRR